MGFNLSLLSNSSDSCFKPFLHCVSNGSMCLFICIYSLKIWYKYKLSCCSVLFSCFCLKSFSVLLSVGLFYCRVGLASFDLSFLGDFIDP